MYDLHLNELNLVIVCDLHQNELNLVKVCDLHLNELNLVKMCDRSRRGGGGFKKSQIFATSIYIKVATWGEGQKIQDFWLRGF